MGFKCGIIGLPNVGKSTLFNALTQANIAAENYPFCTIEPNVGIVPTPDPRLDQLASIAHSEKTIPAVMEFIDIAGLVKGASTGEGLGNRFLSHIRQTDAIAHVVRCFDDDDITHTSGKTDPQSDTETINLELILADLSLAERLLAKATKASRSGDQKAREKIALFERICAHLARGQALRSLDLSSTDQKLIKEADFLSDKPMMYIANVSEEGFTDNPYLDTLQAIALQEAAEIVAVCAHTEAEIAYLPIAEQAAFLTSLGLKESGLDRLITAGYTLLGLQTFFTAGPKEARAWTIPQHSQAIQAADRIHSDFAKGFIRAEVIAYADYIAENGEAGAKQAGKWRLEGKNYIMQDGDVVYFRFNV